MKNVHETWKEKDCPKNSIFICPTEIWLDYHQSKASLVGPEFPNLGTVDILGKIILFCGGFPVHCRMFSSISCLYPLDASNTPLLTCGSQNFVTSLSFANCHLGEKIFLVENHCSKLRKATRFINTTVLGVFFSDEKSPTDGKVLKISSSASYTDRMLRKRSCNHHIWQMGDFAKLQSSFSMK